MEIIHQAYPSGQSPRGVAVQKLVDIEAAAVMRMALKPDEEVAQHVTPVDVLIYIESGSGHISIGNEHEPVSAGDLIVSPKGIPHGLTAGQTGMMLLVLKVPRP